MTDTTKLTKVLLINGKQVTNLVNEKVQLNLHSTGRASFTVVTEDEPKGLVELQIGYQITNLTPYFLGVIEKKHQSNGKWLLTCRELLGALTFPVPIAIRFATAEQVLAQIATLGLEFTTPNKSYITTPVACFYHHGDGISALKLLGKTYQIPNYICQQRPDGKIYIGSWEDSGWATSTIENLPEHTIQVFSPTQGECAAIPKLRPGIKINNRYIIETTLTGNKQRLTWSKTL